MDWMNSSEFKNFTLTCGLDAGVYVALLIITGTLALAIPILLSFTYKRTRLCRRCLWGFPGIVVPINTLTVMPNRVIYVIIFGAMSGDILTHLFDYQKFLPTSSQPYLKPLMESVVSPAAVTLYLSLKYLPLFACVNAPILEMGHILGLIYSCLIITHKVYSDMIFVYCNHLHDKYMLGNSIARRGLVYVCFLMILAWYCWNAGRDLVLMCSKENKSKAEKRNDWIDDYYSQHVKSLLKKRKAQSENRNYKQRWILAMKKAVAIAQGLPLKFTGACAIIFIMLYQITLSWSVLLLDTTDNLIAKVKDNNATIISTLETLNLSTFLYDELLIMLNGYYAVLPLCVITSFIICFLFLLHMATNVHEHLRLVARGSYPIDYSYLAFRMSTSWAYIGFQVASFVAGFATYTLVLCLLGSCGILVFLGFKYYSNTMYHQLVAFVISTAWAGLFTLFQFVMWKFLFIRSEGGGEFVNITNQRLYHCFTYALFIYNAILGLLVAAMRLLTSFLVSLALVIRLDIFIMMEGFELWDTGNYAYVGFLILENTYNNAVVHTFIRLMVDASREKKKCGDHVWGVPFDQDNTDEEQLESVHTPLLVNGDPGDCEIHAATSPYPTGPITLRRPVSIESTDDVNDLAKSRQVRNRWLVAYTLLRNPGLQELTASSIEKKSLPQE